MSKLEKNVDFYCKNTGEELKFENIITGSNPWTYI